MKTLAAGKVRKVRVNKAAIWGEYGAKPFFVTTGEKTKEYNQVEIDGPSRLVFGEAYDEVCGTNGPAAWIETEAAIRVKE